MSTALSVACHHSLPVRTMSSPFRFAFLKVDIQVRVTGRAEAHEFCCEDFHGGLTEPRRWPLLIIGYTTEGFAAIVRKYRSPSAQIPSTPSASRYVCNYRAAYAALSVVPSLSMYGSCWHRSQSARTPGRATSPVATWAVHPVPPEPDDGKSPADSRKRQREGISYTTSMSPPTQCGAYCCYVPLFGRRFGRSIQKSRIHPLLRNHGPRRTAALVPVRPQRHLLRVETSTCALMASLPTIQTRSSANPEAIIWFGLKSGSSFS